MLIVEKKKIIDYLFIYKVSIIKNIILNFKKKFK